MHAILKTEPLDALTDPRNVSRVAVGPRQPQLHINAGITQDANCLYEHNLVLARCDTGSADNGPFVLSPFS